MKDTFEDIVKNYLDEKSIYIKHIDKLRRRFNLYIKLQKEIDIMNQYYQKPYWNLVF